MLIETTRMIPITKLQRELTKKIKEVSEGHEPLYILKNNNMEAVVISFEDYEHLRFIEEIMEHFEIDEVIRERMVNYDKSKNIKWNKLKD